MSYLVLARKWRPQTFDDLIGQEPIARILKNAIEQQRIAHAYLFSGPRGVGKTSSARILAKALNCKEGPTPNPCGICPFCTSITEGSSVDVMEIDGASNNSVNDIRDLRERVKYAPSGGTYKIYIIDETHMLSDAAFNALLKTLEEPPSHVVFVLATTAPQKIPPTVLSRCQHLPFRRISNARIRERLKTISVSEEIQITESALEMIARAADGSMRDSLTILDQISSFSTSIGETDVQALLGLTDFALLSRVSASLISGEREELLRITAELMDKGTDIRSFMKELIQFFRDMLVAGVVKTPGEMLGLGAEEIEEMTNIFRGTSEDHIMLLLAELMKSETDIRNASSPRLAFEIALLKASFLNGMRTIKQVMERLEDYGKLLPQGQIREEATRGSKARLETAPTPPAERAVKEEPDAVPLAEEEPPEELSSADEQAQTDAAFSGLSPELPPVSNAVEKKENSLIDEVWQKALGRMEPPLASKLSKAAIEFAGEKLILTLEGGYSVFADSIKKNLKSVTELVAEELGSRITIEIQVAGKKAVRKKDLKERVLADPAIREALDLFDGRIVDVLPARDQDKG